MAIRELDRKNYTVGQEVALMWAGNKARSANNKQQYTVGVISKIGRNYLYVNDHIQIDIRTGMEKSNIAPNYVLYDSEQDAKDKIESDKICTLIRRRFDTWGEVGVPIEKLRQIQAILSE